VRWREAASVARCEVRLEVLHQSGFRYASYINVLAAGGHELLHRITDFAGSARGKWIVLAIWIIVASVIIPIAPTLSEVTENDTLQFLPEGAESKQAAELARSAFPNAGTPAIIVFRNPDGLTSADRDAAESVFNDVSAMQAEPGSNVGGVVSIFNVPEAEGELIAPDETAMTMIVNVTGSPSEEAYIERIERIREVTDPYDGAELLVKVSGPGGLIADLVSVFAEIDVFLLIVTATLVLVLLVIIYRSPVIAIVPLLIVGLVFQLGGGIAAWVLREVGFPVNGQSSGIMTVILFGAGTDYFLFTASRYREELRVQLNKHEAMQTTMGAVSEAILSAGGTLMVASMLLLLADLGSYQALGPIVAIAIFIMMLAGITLIPAVLAIIGRNGFWPFRPAYEPDATTSQGESRVWSRIAHTVLEGPARVLGVTSLVLAIMIGGMLFFRPSYDSLDSLPGHVDSVQGFEALRESFPAGELAPTRIYVALPDDTSVFENDNLQRIDAVSSALYDLERVVSVSGPANPFGIGRGPDSNAIAAAVAAIPSEIRSAIDEAHATGAEGPPPGAEVDPDSELGQAIGLYAAALNATSADTSVAELTLTLDVNPYGNEAMDFVPDLRSAARDAADANGIARDAVLVGGETAENADTRAANTRDQLIVLPVILLAIMLILGLLLRSVVAALYLGLTIIVTYFATLGLAVMVFRFVFGQDSVGSSVPFFLFVFLNALGVDYSIYLMSRVREEARRSELRAATERALVRTGGVITSAGIILAGTFAALMTLPLRDLFQLGFAVSIGVLIDTFVTRSLLVPSIVMLLGKWNWWPQRAPR
jgi:putative drug exporter of the RND superfamily